jgi:excisionase family DNA binding protein
MGDVNRIAYRPAEAAEIIGISRSSIYELFASGELPARKLGHRTVVLRDDLLAYLDSCPTWDVGRLSPPARRAAGADG